MQQKIQKVKQQVQDDVLSTNCEQEDDLPSLLLEVDLWNEND
jgi:hypothetical protein